MDGDGRIVGSHGRSLSGPDVREYFCEWREYKAKWFASPAQVLFLYFEACALGKVKRSKWLVGAIIFIDKPSFSLDQRRIGNNRCIGQPLDDTFHHGIGKCFSFGCSTRRRIRPAFLLSLSSPLQHWQIPCLFHGNHCDWFRAHDCGAARQQGRVDVGPQGFWRGRHA